MMDHEVDPVLFDRVKQMLRRDLKLGTDTAIDDDMPLIGGDFDLDSLDVVLLIGSIEKEFGIKLTMSDDAPRVFHTVRSLVEYLSQSVPAKAAAATTPTAVQPANFDDLLNGLPHQPPFRFVSRLTHRTAGESARGVWEVDGSETFFAGHFPGRPLVPGVLIGEALAQLSGLITASTEPQTVSSQQEAGLAQLDVRFRRPVSPPARIELESRLTRSVPPLEHFEVRAVVDGQVIAEGQLVLKLAGRVRTDSCSTVTTTR